MFSHNPVAVWYDAVCHMHTTAQSASCCSCVGPTVHESTLASILSNDDVSKQLRLLGSVAIRHVTKMCFPTTQLLFGMMQCVTCTQLHSQHHVVVVWGRLYMKAL